MNRTTRLKSIVTTIPLLLLAAGLLSTPARAELKPKFDKLQLYSTIGSQPVIVVEAEDKLWTRVSTNVLNVSTHYYVSLKKGKLLTISAIYGNFPIAKVRHTSGKWRKGTFRFEIPKNQFGTVENYAINACNELKKNGARTDKDHTTHIGLPFNLFVRAERVGNQAAKTVAGNISAKVICKKAPKLVEISHLNVKYDKTTNKCPIKAVVEVGFNTNRDDKIHFTLGHMNRGLHQTEHTVQPFMISGQYVATKRIELTIDKNTDYVQIKLKDGGEYKRWTAAGKNRVKCPPMKVTSVWLKHKILEPGFCPGRFERTVTINTNAPDPVRYEIIASTGNVPYSGEKGGGVPTLEGNQYVYRSKSTATYNKPIDLELMAKIENHNANSGWMQLKAACVQPQKTTLAFLDFKAPQCPRGAMAVAQIEADAAGPIAYQLDCASEVKSWSFGGIAEAKPTNGKFIAGLGHRLDITKNQKVACALKRKSINGLKIIALGGHQFQCVKKNPDIGEGPSGLKDKPKPTHHVKEPVVDLGIPEPQCRRIWKKSCKTTPVVKCKKVTSKDCKMVPKRKCKTIKDRQCKRVPKRECKIFRGNKVCKTVWKTKCKTVKKKQCKTIQVKKCNVKTKRKCETVNKKSCTRKQIRVCR